MRRICAICEGETVRAWYWMQLRWDPSTQTGVAGERCSRCGHITPDPSSVLLLAEEAPDWLVSSSLKALADAPKQTLSPPAPVKTVLVVDDDPETRRVVRRLLGRQGYAVLEAEDGIEALHMLEAQDGCRPDLVLVDSVMPRMDGEEFLRVLHARKAGIITIAMSGFDRTLPFADGSLPKPIRPETLISVVKEALF